MPTLIYTQDSPPATFVLEDEQEVKRELERAREAGEDSANLTGEGGKPVQVPVRSVTRISPQ